MTTNKLLIAAHDTLGSTPDHERPRWRRIRALARVLVGARRHASAARTTELVLGARRARSVFVRGVPFSVGCLQGDVWITHTADPGDHVLAAGREFKASGPGHLVVVTFAPSRIMLSGRGRVGD